jgi:hypothetical protein
MRKSKDPRQLELFDKGGFDWRHPVGQFLMHGILETALGRDPTEAELLTAIGREEERAARRHDPTSTF